MYEAEICYNSQNFKWVVAKENISKLTIQAEFSIEWCHWYQPLHIEMIIKNQRHIQYCIYKFEGQTQLL